MVFVLLAGSLAFGLILGSFLNVLVSRFPLFLRKRGISVFSGRSYCDHCGKTLLWYELIPIISFLFLVGRCYECGKPIPVRYSLVEALMGGLYFFLGFMLLYAPSVNGISNSLPAPLLILHIFFLCVGLFALVAIFFLDISYTIIPDFFTLLFYGAGIGESALRICVEKTEVSLFISGAVLVLFLLFFSIWFFTKRKGMGFGDVKLAPAFPLFLGSLEGIGAVFFGFWIGAVYSLALLMLKKKKLKDQIPFGPFLVVGAFIVLFFPNAVAWLLFLKYDILREWLF